MRRQHPTAGNEAPGPHTPVGRVPPTGLATPSAPASPATPVGPVEPPRRRRRGVVIGVLSGLAAVATAAEMTLGGISFLTTLGSSSDDDPEFEEVSGDLPPQALSGIADALDAVEAETGQAPELYELQVRAYAVDVSVPDPADPERVDVYRWDGDELPRPDSREHHLSGPDQMGDRLFSAEDIDTDGLTTALEDVRGRHPDHEDHPEAELVPTVVWLDRSDPDLETGDHELTVRIHAGDNVVDSGRSWIVTYDAGGSYVRTFEAGVDDAAAAD